MPRRKTLVIIKQKPELDAQSNVQLNLDIDASKPDPRREFIDSNPKNLNDETLLQLVDIQSDFAQYIISSNLPNNDAANLWKVVRIIFSKYGLK